ncbi:hypothetical protein WKR88_26105 [Trinickia caryophylli]|uniref:Uncharacterized protein n=1 Tax=Trinickia caryophylli TaxID=28094 RepID=A0A1X7GBJ9_TRICW|nr:hypothetical protein [Trinickia caryophylli]TRX17556.1 hypothetical protein FNF07_04475 [Trinickia caryophylli]WQE11694.1 hypothetical protein U0034_18435 [Trinickia caryophylli]SMF66538.1 hypothetical protein SAMN06295900_114127 [Trinickia caryophylli]
MNFIPVTLDFVQLAPNFDAKIVIDTPGVTWSAGERQRRDDLGFSCNAWTPDEAESFSVQSLELTKSTLSLLSGAGAISGGAVTLTAMLCVPDGVSSIEGHCTLNSAARIYVRLGCGVPMEWRHGCIGGYIPKVPPGFWFVTLGIAGLTGGQSIAIELAAGSSAPVRWAMGHGTQATSPLSIASYDGRSMALGRLSITSNRIELVTPTGQSFGSSGNAGLDLALYIEMMGAANSSSGSASAQVHLSATCGDGITVVAKLPGKFPRYIDGVPKTLNLE